MSEIAVGDEGFARFVVGPDDTARAVGSGALDVLGTPRLLAWCESATCIAVADALPAGSTSVGTRIRLDHVAASPVGAAVDVVATVSAVEGRTVTFDVEARDAADGRVVGAGTVTRAVVDIETFLARVVPAPPSP